MISAKWQIVVSAYAIPIFVYIAIARIEEHKYCWAIFYAAVVLLHVGAFILRLPAKDK